MQIITLDFESFFSQDYSLSKMTTEEYIRDPRFQIIGVGVKVGDGPGQWFSGSLSEIREWLFQFNLHEHAVLAHNAMFDMAILNWRLGIRPKLILDTLSMARPIHGTTVGGSLAKLVAHYQLGTKGTDTTWAKGLRREDFTPAQLREYGGYCATREDSDCNLTWRLFHKLLPLTPRPELLLEWRTAGVDAAPRVGVGSRARRERHLRLAPAPPPPAPYRTPAWQAFEGAGLPPVPELPDHLRSTPHRVPPAA
jgi:DNA polymerase